jgi:hypothetical protein
VSCRSVNRVSEPLSPRLMTTPMSWIGNIEPLRT